MNVAHNWIYFVAIGFHEQFACSSRLAQHRSHWQPSCHRVRNAIKYCNGILTNRVTYFYTNVTWFFTQPPCGSGVVCFFKVSRISCVQNCVEYLVYTIPFQISKKKWWRMGIEFEVMSNELNFIIFTAVVWFWMLFAVRVSCKSNLIFVLLWLVQIRPFFSIGLSCSVETNIR